MGTRRSRSLRNEPGQGQYGAMMSVDAEFSAPRLEHQTTEGGPRVPMNTGEFIRMPGGPDPANRTLSRTGARGKAGARGATPLGWFPPRFHRPVSWRVCTSRAPDAEGAPQIVELVGERPVQSGREITVVQAALGRLYGAGCRGVRGEEHPAQHGRHHRPALTRRRDLGEVAPYVALGRLRVRRLPETARRRGEQVVRQRPVLEQLLPRALLGGRVRQRGATPGGAVAAGRARGARRRRGGRRGARRARGGRAQEGLPAQLLVEVGPAGPPLGPLPLVQ